MAEQPNFYLLLDLDPSIDDWNAIEQTLLEKRRAWSRDRSQGNPKARRRAEIGLSLLPDMERKLKDPAERRKQAQEALKQRQQEQRERLRDLDEALVLIKTGGGICGPEQLEKLIQRFDGIFTPAQVRERLQAAGVRVESASGPARRERPVREQIEKATGKRIRQNLDQLGKGNLYDFLELKPQSSPKALADRAEEILRENHRLGKRDAKAAAENDLAGVCKTLFRSDEEKAKYDNFLALEALETLKPNIELTGSDGALTRQEIDALVQQARQRGVPAEDALAFIEEYAAARKWFFQRDERELPSEALKLCGFCSSLAPATASRCATCGEPLEIDCPRCGAKNPSANPACLSCGCRTGDAPLVQDLLREGERIALEGDVEGALIRFEKALLYWPGWRPALEARQRLEARRKEREARLADIEELIRARKLGAARSALERFRRTHGKGNLDGLDHQIRDGLAKADTAFQEGERLRRAGSAEAALDRYEEALALCADFEPATTALAASPPPPPGTLVVTPLAAGFRLTWRLAGSGRGMSYRILRNAGAAPRTAEDGESLGEVRGASFDDIAAPAGKALYYAVFSLRGGTPCHEGSSSGPHLRAAAPVTCLKAARSGPNLVLNWDWPPGTEEVLVAWAHDRYPEEPGEGPGRRARITRREYERAGCWILPHAERLPHYFSVFAKALGEGLYAPAARIVENMGQGLNVSYRVGIKRSLLRRSVEDAWIELTCANGGGDATVLPALLLVGKSQGVPVSPRDGDVLAEVPEVRFDKGRARLPIPDRCWGGRPYIKLFFRDPETARQIRLLPAEKEMLRL